MRFWELNWCAQATAAISSWARIRWPQGPHQTQAELCFLHLLTGTWSIHHPEWLWAPKWASKPSNMNIRNNNKTTTNKWRKDQHVKATKPPPVLLIPLYIDRALSSRMSISDTPHVFSCCKTVSYTHLTLPTTGSLCRSRWSPYH